MKSVLKNVAAWIFLGNHALKKPPEAENILRVITLNMIALLGSIYVLIFLPTIIGLKIFPSSYTTLMFVFVIAFITVHTEKGLKYFDYAKVVVVVNSMLLFGLLYADTSYGYVWTFLLPLMIIFVMELRWGLICCLIYYAFMVVVELKTGKYGLSMFARFTCIFWAQSALIATYETFRSMTRNRLLKDKEEVEYLSIIDHLTKLYNRRHFSKSMENEFARAIREKENLGFLMIDADHFKEYNDAHGHLKGDELLASIADVLRKVFMRSTDLVFRMGGEEFGVLLPNTDIKGAYLLAEKIRMEIGEMGVITVSVGYASVLPEIGENPENLFKRADENLYRAKELGRNRVVGA